MNACKYTPFSQYAAAPAVSKNDIICMHHVDCAGPWRMHKWMIIAGVVYCICTDTLIKVQHCSAGRAAVVSFSI